MDVFLENSENQDALFYLSNTDQFCEKEKHFSEQIGACNEQLEKINKLLEQLVKIRVNKKSTQILKFSQIFYIYR
jgi:uncharacterized protein (DUF342 family)